MVSNGSLNLKVGRRENWVGLIASLFILPKCLVSVIYCENFKLLVFEVLLPPFIEGYNFS